MGRPTNFTIFEASNESRQELYIGMTSLSMNALIAAFGKTLPHTLRSWRKDEISYRSLEFGMSAKDAAAFIRRYAPSRGGWRVIRARKPAGTSRTR